MYDYSVISAIVLMLGAFFVVASMGLWPSAFDPRYVTAGLCAAGVTLLVYIMRFCYRIAVELRRLNWLLAGEDSARPGLDGTLQALRQQVERINKELK